MRDQILDFIRERGGGVSFAEFARHFGDDFKGDLVMVMAENENIVLWGDMSQAFIDALVSLLEDGLIEMEPTESLVYIIDGLTSTLPVVRSNYRYKTPHWLPVAFNLAADSDQAPAES